MPEAFIDKINKICGISKDRLETLWSKAEEIAQKEYEVKKSDGDKYYQVVTGIFKKMLGKDCLNKLGKGESEMSLAEKILTLFEDRNLGPGNLPLLRQEVEDLISLKELLASGFKYVHRLSSLSDHYRSLYKQYQGMMKIVDQFSKEASSELKKLEK